MDMFHVVAYLLGILTVSIAAWCYLYNEWPQTENVVLLSGWLAMIGSGAYIAQQYTH